MHCFEWNQQITKYFYDFIFIADKMTDHHNNHDQNGKENHEDCEDCKREKAENEKLIAIYEKLQEVDQRTTKMKASIDNHKDNAQKSLEGLRKIDQKVEKIKSNKQEQKKGQIQQLGFSLLADMIEKQKKSQAQNQRLRQMLRSVNIGNEKTSKASQQTSQKSVERNNLSNHSSFVSQTKKSQQQTALQWFQKVPITSRLQSRKSNSFREQDMGKSFEIFSTKSSFTMTKRKTTLEKKDFQELNLWLFDQRNTILQKELYDKSTKQQNNSPNLELSLLFQSNKVGRYIKNAKNVERLKDSSNLESTRQRRLNVSGNKQGVNGGLLNKRGTKVALFPSITNK